LLLALYVNKNIPNLALTNYTADHNEEYCGPFPTRGLRITS